MEIPEGIWDMRILSSSTDGLLNIEFGSYLRGRPKPASLSVAVVKDSTTGEYRMYRMDGVLLDFVLVPSATSSVLFFKKAGAANKVKLVFPNGYQAMAEECLARDLVELKPGSDEKEVVSLELTRLFPSEKDIKSKGPVGKKTGTGFFVRRDGTIATNLHVIDGAKTILVTVFKGDAKKEYAATVLFSDKNNDLAIIKISDTSFRIAPLPYTIRKDLLDVGSEVFSLGYPMTTYLGTEIKFNDGKVNSKTGFQGDIATYQISVPIQPGNSGGPLFDRDGNVVGITNAKFLASDNIAYAIKANFLTNLMDLLPHEIPTNGIDIKSKSLTEKISALSPYVVFLSVGQ